MTETAMTRGAHHVGLTVPDLTTASDFFVQTLGFRQVGERPEYPAVFVTDGALRFDRQHHVGLHHLVLKVARNPTWCA